MATTLRLLHNGRHHAAAVAACSGRVPPFVDGAVSGRHRKRLCQSGTQDCEKTVVESVEKR